MKWISLLLVVVILSFARLASAAEKDDKCDGPADCCLTKAEAVKEPLPTKARVGLRVMRIERIAETEGNFAGEFAILVKWKAGALRPELNPRNIAEPTIALDETRLRDGVCYRERRVLGKFQTWFRLRRFPFDAHDLRINLEDRVHPTTEILYEKDLWPNTISIDALREMPSWMIPQAPHIASYHDSSFAYPMTDPHPQLVLVHIPVARHTWFYVTRFFLPLLLLVAIAYSIFYVRADDLSSSSAIGITCMLSIIALQLAQADSLPRVPYLTIADRIYVVCYVLIALSLACAVAQAHWHRNGREDFADRFDHWGRKWYPVLFVVATGVSVVWGWYWNSTEDADVEVPAPAVAPPGES